MVWHFNRPANLDKILIIKRTVISSLVHKIIMRNVTNRLICSIRGIITKVDLYLVPVSIGVAI